MHYFQSNFTTLLRKIIALFPVLLIVLTIIVCRQYLDGSITIAAVKKAASLLSWQNIAWACLLTLISYVALALQDVIAAKIIAPRTILISLAAYAGIAGNAICNTLGFHVFTGSWIRYRIYKTAGINSADTLRITALTFLGLLFGYIGIIAVAFVFLPNDHSLLAIPVVLFILILISPEKWKQKFKSKLGKNIVFPNKSQAIFQLLIATTELAAAIGALYVLMPHNIGFNFSAFILIYIGAIWLGIISHVPGGLCIFESAILLAVHDIGYNEVLAALLFYRCIYNLMPFASVAVSLIFFEATRRQAFNVKADSV